MSIKQLFANEAVEFEFQIPISQAIDNLSASTIGSQQTQTTSETMMGSINRDSTYLFRSVRGSRNSFRPTFYGKFQDDGNKKTLTGEFSLNRVVRKFIIFWCALVGIVALVTLVTVLRNPQASWVSLAYVVFMLVACLAFSHFMYQKSQPDIDWLKNQIASATQASVLCPTKCAYESLSFGSQQDAARRQWPYFDDQGPFQELQRSCGP